MQAGSWVGAEGCDPGNSNHTNPSNDEPDSPGRGRGDPQPEAAGTGVVGEGTRTLSVHLPCTDAGGGRVATVLQALDATTGPELATRLAAVVAPGATTATVLSDDRSDGSDAAIVQDALAAAGWTVTLLPEPAGGLAPTDLDGAHLVLQGDDVSLGLGLGGNADPSALTGLHTDAGGLEACGVRMDGDGAQVFAWAQVVTDEGTLTVPAVVGWAR